MKNTVFSFLQKEVLALELTPTDCLILEWFMEESGNGNLEKKVYKEHVFFTVNYKDIIPELPVTGISTVEGYSARFSKYVAMELLIRRRCEKGICFSPTPRLNAMYVGNNDND
jgi:hypothetical protein